MAVFFVSYAHEDEAFARELCQELDSRGTSTWRDTVQLREGDHLPLEIVSALDRSTGFILLLSRDSLASGWVRLELGAALVRRAEDASFRLIPVILDDSPAPALLRSLFYIDGRALHAPIVAERISTVSRHAPAILPEGTVESVVRALEADQYSEAPNESAFGGWGKSYGRYLTVSFPDRPPKGVSTMDSVSATHFVVRGLLSAQRLGLNSSWQGRVQQLLVRARCYLNRHFDGVASGLIAITSQGERLRRDPRHSATFVKALAALKGEDADVLRRATEYAILRFQDDGDGRLATAAEVYHLTHVVQAHRHLRSDKLTDRKLTTIRKLVEHQLLSAAFDANCDGGPVRLLHEGGQPHMSLYYSWWVLDACGEQLSHSADGRVRTLVGELVSGLRQFGIKKANTGLGFPLALGGGADPGMTAQIGDVLLRLAPVESADHTARIAAFLKDSLPDAADGAYPYKFLLWAVPVFWERYLIAASLLS